MKRFLLTCKIEFILLVRNFFGFFFGLIFPLMMLILFGTIYGNSLGMHGRELLILGGLTILFSAAGAFFIQSGIGRDPHLNLPHDGKRKQRRASRYILTPEAAALRNQSRHFSLFATTNERKFI